MLLKEKEVGAEINFIVTDISVNDLMDIINVGAVTLKVEDREFVLDAYYTDFNATEFNGNPAVEVRCKLEVDEDTFPDSYTLTCEDLLSKDLVAMFYCGFEGDIEYEAINMLTTVYCDGKTIEFPTINED